MTGGGTGGGSSGEAIRLARAAAEDESDRHAATSVRDERVGEVAEFDETKQLSSSSSSSSSSLNPHGGKREEVPGEDAREDAKLEEHLRQLWKGDGNALQALENALRPVEKYALRFREEIEPVWTKAASEAWRRQMLDNAHQREWDMEELQRRKEQMERAMDESEELVLAAPSSSGSGMEKKRTYFGERVRIEHAQKKQRRRKGNDWEVHVDERTSKQYWYNTTTHDCTWSKPLLLAIRDSHTLTLVAGFALMPPGLLRFVLTFLEVSPDVLQCRATCRHYARVADHPSLWYRVLAPAAFEQYRRGDDVWGSEWGVHMGYSDNGWGVGPNSASVVALTHYTMQGRVFGAFSEALAASHAGQTICFSPGTHGGTHGGSHGGALRVGVPVRLIAGDGLGDVAPPSAEQGPRGAFKAAGSSSSSSSSSSAETRDDLVKLQLSSAMEVCCTGTVHVYGLNILMAPPSSSSSSSSSSSTVAESCMAITKGSLHLERVTLSNSVKKDNKQSRVTAIQCEITGDDLVVKE